MVVLVCVCGKEWGAAEKEARMFSCRITPPPHVCRHGFLQLHSLHVPLCCASPLR